MNPQVRGGFASGLFRPLPGKPRLLAQELVESPLLADLLVRRAGDTSLLGYDCLEQRLAVGDVDLHQWLAIDTEVLPQFRPQVGQV